jgi:serine/threonine protein kinase
METGDKLGIISMELADGYTELNELLDNHTHRNYEHFFSLSIAEIIILFAKLKYVNIDFHPKNILKNENNGDVRLIDFGRIANVNTSGDSGFPDDEKKDKVIGNYNRITSGNYENDRKAAIRVNIFKLYGSRITDDVIFENLHKIIKFYCCLDFAINSTYYNSNMRPQCMEFVKYIYGINSFDVNGLVINEKSKAQFLKISKKIIDIITPKMSSRNSMSRDAVDRQKRNGNFLIINKKISQYNVKYFPKEKKFKRHPDVFDLQNNAIIFFICCLCFYILKYKKFGGAITSSLFRKSINPASLSYSASKLLPNDKNDELKIKKYILKYVVKEIKKHNPCIKIDVTEIDANEIIPMSIEEYEEQIEKYKDSITNTKITADECEINSKIYIPDIDSILKIIMKKPKAITHKSQSVSELTRSQSVSEISRSPSELSRSQSVSEISRSLFEGGRRKTRKINNKL